MTMHLARGLSTLNTKKQKQKPLTKAKREKLVAEHRAYNKRMKQLHAHDQQMTFDEYVAYTRGQYTPKRKEEKEFKTYAPSKPYVRDTKEYRSLQTSDAIPGYAPKRETQQYTGDLIVGIGTMHKSNAVPIMRGTKQAEEIAKMRR